MGVDGLAPEIGELSRWGAGANRGGRWNMS